MSTAVFTQEGLVPANVGERWGGFGNLLSKELGQWWRTKLWWIQALLWIVILGGINSVVMANPDGMAPAEHMEESMYTFFASGLVVVGIGIVVTVQSAMIGEKDLGTAAWVLSKPVSRSSFVITKLLAHSFGFIMTGVFVPAGVYLISARGLLPMPVDGGAFAIGLAVFALGVVFLVTLTLALGTVFDNRGPVAGIGVGWILTGQVLRGLFPPAVFMVTPWALPNAATSYALESTPDWNRLTPVLVTAALTLMLAGFAVWRFGREEF